MSLFIGACEEAGIRPQDFVGAIANETSLSGRDVGSIEISQRFSTAQVPAAAATEAIRALSATRIQGNKVQMRRDRH